MFRIERVSEREREREREREARFGRYCGSCNVTGYDGVPVVS